MRVTLRIMPAGSTPAQGKRMDLKLAEGARITIGRKGCNVTIDDARLSREHLEISVKNGCLVARDMDSRNGSLLRGKKISKVELAENDSLVIGATVILFSTVKVAMVEGTESGLIEIEDVTDPSARPGAGSRHVRWNGNEAPAGPARPSKPIPSQEPPEEAPQPRGFLFLKDGHLDLMHVLDFIWDAYSDWRGIWRRLPLEGLTASDAVFGLAVGTGVSAAAAGLLGGIKAVFSRDMTGLITETLVGPLAIFLFNLVVTLVSVVLLRVFRGFFGARGTFADYVGFCAYACLLNVPATVLAVVDPILGALAETVVLVWVLWGFSRVFGASAPRVVGLMLVGVLGPLLFIGYSMNSLKRSMELRQERIPAAVRGR